jgi:hypothetical protein
MRFETPRAVKMSKLFWVVELHGLPGRYQGFGRKYCLHGITPQNINGIKIYAFLSCQQNIQQNHNTVLLVVLYGYDN